MTLSNILKACSAANMRSTTPELEQIGIAAENINKDFEKTHYGLRLRSFYERLPLADAEQPILDSRHATMGLPEEQKIPLNATHATICRFESASDPSFIAIQDALINTFEEILDELVAPERVQDQMRQLGDYFDVADGEFEELANISDRQCPDTCEWLLQSPSFLEWRDPPRDISPANSGLPPPARRSSLRHGHSRPPRIFWLTGAPGAGKSVLASSVVRCLKDRECSFFFTKHVDVSRRSLSGLLRSMTIQMARRNVALRRALLSMRQSQQSTVEFADGRTFWRQFFLGKILQHTFQQRQYWVIDSLDDCPGGHDLVELFAKIPIEIPFSIFITSRRDRELADRLSKYPLSTTHISNETIHNDIRTFLERDAKDLPAESPAELEDLIQTLVTKANGSFLWASLVLPKLKNAWSEISVKEVIRKIPDGMPEVYANTFADLDAKVTGTIDFKMVKAVLKWVVCSRRPLALDEIYHAVRLDVGEKPKRLDRMIETIFSQILELDSQKRVRLLHDTIADFLLQPHNDSEYAINKADAHEQLADVCLDYLVSHGSKRISREAASEKFEEYAHLFWSDHVLRGPQATSMGPSQQLSHFLGKTVLSWIEFVARRNNLNCLIKTAGNLRLYISRRVDAQAPLTPSMADVREWATDLIRLVTVFGRNLIQQPASIYRIIPPLCPINSKIYARFGHPTNGLEVVGLSPRGWSDRISSAAFENYSTSLACCKERHAVGLKDEVVVYHADTCQELLRIQHDERVDIIEFAYAHHWIIFAGRTSIKICDYDTSGVIRSIDLAAPPMALALTEDDAAIITVCNNSTVTWWNVHDGTTLHQTSWPTTGAEAIPRPQRAYISTEVNTVVLAARNKPLYIFDLENGLSGPRKLNVPTSEQALAFNHKLDMLAVCFFNGELCTYTLSELREVNHTEVDACALATSPDGATLIVGLKSGGIQVHDFESLNVLHFLPGPEDDEILSLAFAPSGLRFLDVRRQGYNVWEPAALFRRGQTEDSASDGQHSFSTSQSRPVHFESAEDSPITSMVDHHTGDFVFCGKENGDVSVYELAGDTMVNLLYKHGQAPVLHLDWNASKEILVSCDTSSMLQIHQITATQYRANNRTMVDWGAKEMFKRPQQHAVHQVLLSSDGEYVMISTAGYDDLRTLDGKHVHTHPWDRSLPPPVTSPKWAKHPMHKHQLLRFESHSIHSLEWSNRRDTKPSQRIVPIAAKDRFDFKRRFHFVRTATETYLICDDNPLTRLIVWCSPSFSTPSSSATSAAAAVSSINPPPLTATATHAQSTTQRRLTAIADQVVVIVGLYRSQLVFVDHDSWICSLKLDEESGGSSSSGGGGNAVRSQEKGPTRHFPIPHCWQGGGRGVLCLVTVKGDVVIARNDELAVVKRGLVG